MSSFTDDQNVIAAAWLHDVLEDTKVTYGLLGSEFNLVVADYVLALTDSTEGNRATRKAADRARLAAAPPEVQTIKLADLIDNTASITHHDPKFNEVYLEEKLLLLEVMTQGEPTLYRYAKELTCSNSNA